MGLFIPLMLAIAIFWLAIGVMLAKFLAQKYKGKPWKTNAVDEHYIYGSALNNDRSGTVHSGGYGYGNRGDCVAKGGTILVVAMPQEQSSEPTSVHIQWLIDIYIHFE
ncbi:hypothetical protein E8E13_004083 [Curvularia kusanoi]|uniref:Uncharacterized protein n=1 Tax=Curvularia kusanoi TaxID=90978 RepID=A0A9P4TEM8_CURKU|nr:hypothetical protein E8E13_004083 [Curvularia kusanoi]